MKMQIDVEITESFFCDYGDEKKKAFWKHMNMKFSSLFTWESVK
jgi:hypothetical protein